MKFNSLFAHALAGIVVLASSHLASALEVGQQGPCVELDDVQPNGTTVNQCIRTREGHTTFALLEFFSTTCSDCAENLPKLSSLAASISATTTTRLVGIDRNASDTQSYIPKHKDLIQFPVAIDSDRDATDAYGVHATPTVFLLDAKNKIIFKHEGVFSADDITTIQDLVK